MALLLLPIEIQEHILSLLDATSLVRCRNVCRLWSVLTQGCWQQCCLREVPADVLIEILGLCQPIHCAMQANTSPLTWEMIFMKWNHYSVVSNTPHQAFSLPFRNTGAGNRCIVQLSGDFLILAPTVENVRVYKVHIYDTGKCVGIVAKHVKPIQDIALMDIQRVGMYRIRGSKKIAEHDAVISISLDRCLQINEINCYGRRPLKLWETLLHSDCLEATIKVFGDTCVTACSDRTVYIWKVSWVKCREHSRLLMVSLGEVLCPIPLTHINIWKDQVICLWWNLPGVHLMSWDLNKHTWVENIYIDNILCGPNISTYRSLIFGVGTQLTILKNGQFFQKYDLWEKLGECRISVENATSVCLQRNLLVLGTQLGEIYIFVINKDSQLRELKSVSPVNVIKIATASHSRAEQEINKLYISFDGSGLQIAAQTTQAVHVIRWYPQKKEFRIKAVIELPSLRIWDDKEEAVDLSDPEYWFYDSD